MAMLTPRSYIIVIAFLVLILTFGSAPRPVLAEASFHGLGDLPGGSFSSCANAISGDGKVIVGYGTTAPGGWSVLEAYRYSESAGMVGMGFLPGGAYSSQAVAVSANGSVIVGAAYTAGQEYVAFRWTQAAGMVSLSPHPWASGTSADGGIVVGSGSFGYGIGLAFRWTPTEGTKSLGDLPGGLLSSQALGISADGSVVVGNGWSDSGQEAFRWTQAEGMIGLGDLPGGTFESVARAVSADGSVLVGWSQSAAGLEAFRWTKSGGMVGLGDLPGGSFSSQAFAVSGDGSVVVGIGSGSEAFLWTPQRGMQDLREFLSIDCGLDLAGWRLSTANGISADGMVIVGNGYNPQGQWEAWVATLPEPATLSLLALGGAMAIRLRRSPRRAGSP